MREYFIWLFKFITVIAVFFVGLPILLVVFLAGSITMLEQQVTPTSKKPQVAVIELSGVIDSSKDVVDELYKQVDNEKIKAVVLRINSPGGAVGPSQDIYSAVKKLKSRKPIVASMESLAASGGLYSAVSASKIFCAPGTLTGSIGVILQVPNLTRIAELVKFDMITVKSGKFKDVGNSFREMTQEDRDFLQTTVLSAYEDFVSAVAEGRNLKVEDVRPFADGRVILGTDAKKLKLVDEFGDIYDAAGAALDLAGVKLAPGELPELVYSTDKWKKLREFVDTLSSFSLRGAIHPSMSLQYIMN